MNWARGALREEFLQMQVFRNNIPSCAEGVHGASALSIVKVRCPRPHSITEERPLQAAAQLLGARWGGLAGYWGLSVRWQTAGLAGTETC